MRKFLPKSLAGRTVMVLVSGLIVTQIVTVIVFSKHRADSLTRSEEQHIVKHIASIADIIESVPNLWRDRIVRSFDNHTFNVSITSIESGTKSDKVESRIVASNRYLSRQIRSAIEGVIQVDAREVGNSSRTRESSASNGWLVDRLRPLIYGHDDDQAVFVSIPISEAQWLNFSTVLPLADVPGWGVTVAMTGSFLLVVLLVSLWAVRQLSAPLRRFASATTAFARDVHSPALPEHGPSEVIEAAKAFNDMQQQVRSFIENRAQMLAAISHDIKTPLTTIRLRAEDIKEPELRTRILASVGDMDAMLSSTIAFANGNLEIEENCMTDIGALVHAICDDMADIGHDVICSVEGNNVVTCRPFAIKRAITNLIENAVKYGNCAKVWVWTDSVGVEIAVKDKGPGIPETELERIFLPFFRLEISRSRDTGGAGLGLAIAHSIIVAHGGSVVAKNSETGGLGVQVCLPVMERRETDGSVTWAVR